MPRPKSKAAKASSEDRPAKRAKFLSDAESSDSDSEGANGVSLLNGRKTGTSELEDAAGFKINEEFARRFEHNKQREEKQRLEEKFKDEHVDSESDSESETEDDEGELATQELDSEIFATLDAIRSKDPRVYDSSVTFYRPIDEDGAQNGDKTKQEKPMYLRDYHRKNLLEGTVNEETEETPIPTYAQEQEAMRSKAVKEMHAPAEGDDDQEMKDASDDDDGFLVKKDKSAHDDMPMRAKRKQKQELDVNGADKDPETFLSNFMAARAWVPDEKARFTALESDDSDDDRLADGWEEAYNLRFENPQSANERLMSYGRDLAKLSARREDLSGRKKQREKEREAKEAIQQIRRDDKARLRKLRIEEVERKVKLIKEAAGLRGQDMLNLDEWGNVLDDDFDDAQWEQEMEKRFGDKYYAERDDQVGSGDEGEGVSKKRSAPKKPKWDDDIDINDLVPEFADEEPGITLSDEEIEDVPVADADAADEDEDTEVLDPSAPRSKKDRARTLSDKKRASRKERREIEDLVDAQMTTSSVMLPSKSKTSQAPAVGFRYRETSPTNFGLTARDILFADDTQLNEFAGLKKMAAFRDEEKKNKDRKKLGKKARLRQWRKDTFGNDEGYKGDFADFVRSKGGDETGVGGAESNGKRRKGKKRKADK